MGNTRSLTDADDQQADLWWNNNNSTNSRLEEAITGELDEQTNSRNRIREEELDDFKLELVRKRERRKEIMAEKKKEMQDLREEVSRLRDENQALKRANPNEVRSNLDDIDANNLELRVSVFSLQKDLQEMRAEIENVEQEREDYRAHVVALKDVVAVSKQMLLIRESQLKELRDKVKEIEETLGGKELSALSQDLRVEYEKQLQNIRNLRVFYDERQRADRKERDELKRVAEGVKQELEEEFNKNKELKETVERLQEENSKKYDEVKSLESSLGLTKAECRQYQSELAVINQLFSQILLGFNNSPDIKVDKLIALLEENHHILQEIAINEDSAQVSALPKVLLDLVTEIKEKETEHVSGEDIEPVQASIETSTHQLNSASEIVENLPKVWKVLIELLSHQSAPAAAEDKVENPCYKMVDTPKGPSLVLSVSQTFIRLKDLILEKKCLERETYRLKHLNTHLECRLQEQEKRLGCVSSELSETWHVVGKLQKKHQLLHTQEKILRYELAQKRKLLTELKEELEYSREKWQEARAKNSNTEKQWEQLRIEFASRKARVCDDSSNSVESGYSDDKESSEDEPGYETDASECAQKVTEGQDATLEEVSSIVEEDEELDAKVATLEEVSSIFEEESHFSSSFIDGVLVEKQPEASSSRAENIVEVISEELEAIAANFEQDSTNRTEVEPVEVKSFDEVLTAREERLRRLEGQCSSLVQQVTNTSTRGTAISNKLDALHEFYGSHGDAEAESEASHEADEAAKGDQTAEKAAEDYQEN